MLDIVPQQTATSPAAAQVAGIGASGKQWRLPVDCQVDAQLLAVCGGSAILAKLLAKRGICNAKEAQVFLDPSQYIESSFNELPDIDKAVSRVRKAIANNEHITVYGDYDVDGVTGTCVLLTVLRSLGASVDYYIPSRTNEGYGLNLKALSVLASKHRTKLIISCDCGVSNFAEINFARSLGVDTIVLDHHTMPELLPPAVAIVHPKLLTEEHALYHLPGVGVAYKFCQGLLESFDRASEAAELLDLVTLGMIADMVPLVKECRYLVQIGLPALAVTKRVGLQALLSQVRAGNGTDVVGFGIAPRINAVGRLSDAKLAVELLTTEDQAVAEDLAHRLHLENARRQELCEKILLEAEQVLQSRGSTECGAFTSKAIAIFKEGWHHGVVGIVASRLVEKYNCPVFIGELDTQEGIMKGSARGVEGIDLFETLKENEHLLSKWGGHKMAAGFSMEATKAKAFCQSIVATCERMLANKASGTTLNVDLVIEPNQLNKDLASVIAQMAPFGMGNKKPVLVIKEAFCAGAKPLGKEGKHSRLMLRAKQINQAVPQAFEAVYWNSRGRVPEEGLNIDIAFFPEINSFNGQERLQLVLNDWLDLSKPAIVNKEPEKNSINSKAKPDILSVQENYQVKEEPAIELDSRVQAIADELDGIVVPDAPPLVMRSLDSTRLVFKDLREHGASQALVDAAIRKLGNKLCIFAENNEKHAMVNYVDRTTIGECEHLMLWQYPPNQDVLKAIFNNSRAKEIYWLSGPSLEPVSPSLFLKKLMGLVRYALTKKDGQAEAEKLAAVLGTSKMALALGLTIFRKINLIDWFAEEGIIHLDVMGEPIGQAEEMPEYNQLAKALRSIEEYRDWCANASMKEIQLAIAPNQIVSRRTNE